MIYFVHNKIEWQTAHCERLINEFYDRLENLEDKELKTIIVQLIGYFAISGGYSFSTFRGDVFDKLKNNMDIFCVGLNKAPLIFYKHDEEADDYTVPKDKFVCSSFFQSYLLGGIDLISYPVECLSQEEYDRQKALDEERGRKAS